MLVLPLDVDVRLSWLPPVPQPHAPPSISALDLVSLVPNEHVLPPSRLPFQFPIILRVLLLFVCQLQLFS